MTKPAAQHGRSDGPRVVVFDLDDTLYQELTYVQSGFSAVAAAAEARWNVDQTSLFELMWTQLHEAGRGAVFDVALRSIGRYSRGAVQWMVQTYRHHEPKLKLPAESRAVLDALKIRGPLYLVTDGHKVVQAKKVDALRIRPWFAHCYLTNRYGRRHQKPSPHVFELILGRESAAPGDVVYVGDNPTKDFCGIRPLGFRTIRVLTGGHAAVNVPSSQDAEVSVERLSGVLDILDGWRCP